MPLYEPIVPQRTTVIRLFSNRLQEPDVIVITQVLAPGGPIRHAPPVVKMQEARRVNASAVSRSTRPGILPRRCDEASPVRVALRISQARHVVVVVDDVTRLPQNRGVVSFCGLAIGLGDKLPIPQVVQKNGIVVCQGCVCSPTQPYLYLSVFSW